MEKYITDERTGWNYELVGDYYLLAGDNEPEDEQEEIGIWGQRHCSFLKKNQRSVYNEFFSSGKLVPYLIQINNEAQEMYDLLMKQYAEIEGVTEQLKAEDQMEWVRRTENIRSRVKEVVLSELIYC